jgi:hypothetical protein
VVSKEQLYVAIPLLFDAMLIGALIAYINGKFRAVDTRFDEMRDPGRAELHRLKRFWTCA